MKREQEAPCFSTGSITIQQDIENLLEKIEQEFAFADITPYHFAYDIRASFRGVLAHQKALAELLLRLSNIKPTGLWPSSANDEPETPLPSSKLTLRELSKDRQKVRKQHWAPGEYMVLDSNGIIVKSTFYVQHKNMLIGQLGSTDWERYEEEERPKTTGLTLRELISDGQKVRKVYWEPGDYVIFDNSGYVVNGSANKARHFGWTVFDLGGVNWELYENPKTTGLPFLEATEDGQKARRPHWGHEQWVQFSGGCLVDRSGEKPLLTEESYRANDWEIYKDKAPKSVKTMTGYEAAKLVMEGKEDQL